MMTRSKTKPIATNDLDKKYSTIPHDDVVPKMLNPVLWETLPREMVVLILARLSVPDIICLKRLSKEWRRDLTRVNSDINQTFDEVCPNMIAVFSNKFWMFEGLPHSDFKKTICDLRTLSTHNMQYFIPLHPNERHPIRRNPTDRIEQDLFAHDGGLLCIVSSKINPLCIVVENFLTLLWRKLPPLLYNYLTPPQMMNIEVDSKTKHYKVVVIGQTIEVRSTVEIYDSSVQQWTKAIPPLGHIFGVAVKWHYDDVHKVFKARSLTRSVYDFGEGQLKSCDEKDPPERALLMFTLKGCMFVLHRNTSNGETTTKAGYSITKYCSEKNAKEWVKERSYSCSPFEDLPEMALILMWTLKACKDFVMMFPRSSYNPSHSQSDFWILDLAVGKWSSLPNCNEGYQPQFLSRAFWNVMP